MFFADIYCATFSTVTSFSIFLNWNTFLSQQYISWTVLCLYECFIFSSQLLFIHSTYPLWTFLCCFFSFAYAGYLSTLSNLLYLLKLSIFHRGLHVIAVDLDAEGRFSKRRKKLKDEGTVTERLSTGRVAFFHRLCVW